MIQTIVHIILFGLLVFVIYQDWKIRAVHVLVFPLLAGCSVYLFWQMKLDWEILLLNSVFVLTIIGVLFLYISIKKGKLVNLFGEYFGLGDLLFLLAITPLFGQRNFMLFVITGIFLTLLIELVMMRKREDKTNPLAGYLAKYVIVAKAVALMFNPAILYIDLI